MIAPASADFIARLTVGMANDLLSYDLSCRQVRLILLAPAMNSKCTAKAITQQKFDRPFCLRGTFILLDQ